VGVILADEIEGKLFEMVKVCVSGSPETVPSEGVTVQATVSP
jgi:hypothetical protein